MPEVERCADTIAALNTVPYKLELGSSEVPIQFSRNNKARRYILRFQEGAARVTIPRSGTLQYAHEFARKNSAWIERQLRRAPAEWTDGTIILFRGLQITLQVERLSEVIRVMFSDQMLQLDPLDDIRAAVEARMRTLATQELVNRTWEMARDLKMEIRAVTVRNQRSRWGSCSVRKAISLNWRLIQAPEFVRDYIIVHELMHLKEMNHSARFWSHVESGFSCWREAEKWLRKNSGLLR
jgi:predicted metal-dependent hydrolase